MRVRILGAEELARIRQTAAARQKALRHKCETTRGDELDYNLASALVWCRSQPLPDWLFELLFKRLTSRQPTKDEVSWQAVRMARDELGMPWDTRWEYDADGHPLTEKKGAYDQAAEWLEGTEWAGSARAMRDRYGKVESVLRSKGGGRPRKYRPPQARRQD